MRILIADDEALTRMGLRTMLRGLGEREAFLEIQHRARQEQRPMREVANEILGR